MATGGLEETGATQDTANHERPAANKVAESDLDIMFPFRSWRRVRQQLHIKFGSAAQKILFFATDC
jgi:hypothetical protein